MDILKAFGFTRRATQRTAARGDAQAGDVAATIRNALHAAGLPTPGGSSPIIAPLPVPAAQHRAGGLMRSPVTRLRQGDPGAALRESPPGGRFIARNFSSEDGARAYRLYVPSMHDLAGAQRLALIVMLHGCTQTPEDFAAGTRMNALAERHGFLVAYPEQTAAANGSRCWNWFSAADQGRGRGEPALIAGITRAVAAEYRVDPQRIFAAGLSAGAAMALILGRAYPDIYAGIGVHSGLPYRCAHDVPSAFAAMRAARDTAADARTNAAAAAGPPTIVFHGDSDHTVAPRNAEAIVTQECLGAGYMPLATQSGDSANGRRYERRLYGAPGAAPRLEFWLVHGAGHAWSGGSAGGSYTDPAGPDASAEMVRFFCAAL